MEKQQNKEKKKMEPPFVSGKVATNEPSAMILSRDVAHHEHSPQPQTSESREVAYHPKIVW